MSNPIEFRFIERRVGRQRRKEWRVHVRRNGRILLTSEYYRELRKAEQMVRRLCAMIILRGYKWTHIPIGTPP